MVDKAILTALGLIYLSDRRIVKDKYTVKMQVVR